MAVQTNKEQTPRRSEGLLDEAARSATGSLSKLFCIQPSPCYNHSCERSWPRLIWVERATSPHTRATCPSSRYAPNRTNRRQLVPARPPVPKSCTSFQGRARARFPGSTRAPACRGWRPRQPQPTVLQPLPLNEAQRSTPPRSLLFQPTSNP